MAKQRVISFHPTPENCDVCGAKLAKAMYDAKTSNGQWGCICEACFRSEGGTLGAGRGQKYTRVGTGQFQTDMADPKTGGY